MKWSSVWQVLLELLLADIGSTVAKLWEAFPGRSVEGIQGMAAGEVEDFELQVVAYAEA